VTEFLNRTAGRAVTTEPTVSPVEPAELAAWLGGVPATDPILPMLLQQATDSVINYLGKDLIIREWTLTHFDWPVWGTLTARSLGPSSGDYRREIDLPYAMLVSVASVEIYGEETEEYTERDSSIILDSSAVITPSKDPAIVAVYEAGYGTNAASIPGGIKLGIMQLAAFNFEHRGECDALNALNRSGAAETLHPFRKAELFL
jgi:hypothetical protein